MCSVQSLRSSARLGTGYSHYVPENPLLDYIESGEPERLMSLLKSTDVDIYKEHLDHALIQTAANGQPELCDLLLGHGADPNVAEGLMEYQQRTLEPPAFTAQHSQKQMWFLEHTSEGGTALHRAVESGHTQCVKVLLQGGANAGSQDQNGVTALMLACMRRGNEELVKTLLMTIGNHVDARHQKHGCTALHYAAHVGDKEVVQLLVDEGADVDASDNLQNTPLIVAATPHPYSDPCWGKDHKVRCMEILLKGHCFVNIINKFDESALFWAVESHDLNAVDLLLRNNAVVNGDVLRHTCLVLKDATVVSRLLDSALSVSDEGILGILVNLMFSESSKWMMDTGKHEQEVHDVAKVLIKRLHSINSIHKLVLTPSPEFTQMLGQALNLANSSDDISGYGLFGLALKNGKYSIARMLFLCGCDVTRMQQDLELRSYLKQDAWLQTWLPQVLSSPPPLKLSCRSVLRQVHRNRMSMKKLPGDRICMKKLPGELCKFLQMQDMDEVQAYDKTIKDEEEHLLNDSYATRETSKAVSQHALWLYQ